MFNKLMDVVVIALLFLAFTWAGHNARRDIKSLEMRVEYLENQIDMSER
jgi:hypothetical protein